MSKFYQQDSVDRPDNASVNSVDIPETKNTDNLTSIKTGSCDIFYQALLKQSISVSSSNEDFSDHRSLVSYSLPKFKRSFDSSAGSFVSQTYFPRPQKSISLFEIVIKTLRDIYKRYSEFTYVGDGFESSEEGEMCCKVDYRVHLLEALKADYDSMIIEREGLLREIKCSLESVVSETNVKRDVDMIDYEKYCTTCREMSMVEAKLERCCGKLQFQIIELDSVSRVNPLDQYELTIRLNDGLKFKSKIKVEKNGHQIWDNTTFAVTPSIDNLLAIKFIELKGLNKSTVLLDKKLPLINNLILSEPNIYSCWLTSTGTIKLRMIVQWNALLDDPELLNVLHKIDMYHSDNAGKDGIVLRKRTSSDLPKYSPNRASFMFNTMFRFDSFDKCSSVNTSMNDIGEQVTKEEKQPVNIRSTVICRNTNKAKAEYHEDFPEEQMPTEQLIVNEEYVSGEHSECYPAVSLSNTLTDVSSGVVSSDSVEKNYEDPCLVQEDVLVLRSQDKCGHKDSDVDIIECSDDRQLIDLDHRADILDKGSGDLSPILSVSEIGTEEVNVGLYQGSIIEDKMNGSEAIDNGGGEMKEEADCDSGDITAVNEGSGGSMHCSNDQMISMTEGCSVTRDTVHLDQCNHSTLEKEVSLESCTHHYRVSTVDNDKMIIGTDESCQGQTKVLSPDHDRDVTCSN